MREELDLVVVHHASSPSEAEVVRGVLEEAGIVTLIPDQNTPLPGMDLTPFDDSTGMAGCEVMVRAGDHKRALEVLSDARASGSLLDDEGP